jgi:uncharacterized RDD family membrane protein YckC
MELRVATLTRRLAAGLLDLVPVAALAAGVVLWWLQRHPGYLPPRYWNGLDYLVDLVNTRPELSVLAVVSFAVCYVSWETVWTACIGAAPVARVLGIRIVSTPGRRIGFVRALVRAILSLLLAVAAGIGPAWALISGRRRMLHDILCGCLAAEGPLPASSRIEEE